MPLKNQPLPIPTIKREKLVIERIGLGGLMALWLMAVGVAVEVPYLCGMTLFRNRTIAVIGGLICGVLVAARATFRIRHSLAQLRQRRGLGK